MKIELFSHHFVAYPGNDLEKRICVMFALRFAEYSFREPGYKGVKRMVKLYAGSNSSRTEFRYHINAYPEFYGLLKQYGLTSDEIEEVKYDMYVPQHIEYDLNPEKQPREMQPGIIEFIQQPGCIKQVGMQTGKGKTFTALYTVAKMMVRCMIILKKGYIHRWFPDLLGPDSILRLEPDELLVVRGAAHLSEIIIDAVNNGGLPENVKVILVSSSIMDAYYDHYDEMNGDMSLYGGVHPSALMALFGIGVRILDEYHQLLHINFRFDLYTHLYKAIYLSATLVPATPLIDLVYRTVFPPDTRANVGDYDKYIEMTGYMYGLQNDKIRWTQRGSTDYSQVAYEESIMRHEKSMMRYLEWILDHVKRRFIELPDRDDKQKALLFFGTIEFCTVVRDYLIEKLDNDTLSIGRFVSLDPYDTVLESQIIISTHGSLGTAHDIPDLRVCFKFIGMGKEDANIQNAGRLRKLARYPNIVPQYHFMTNRNIPQHLRYHETMRKLFTPRTLKFRELETDFLL